MIVHLLLYQEFSFFYFNIKTGTTYNRKNVHKPLLGKIFFVRSHREETNRNFHNDGTLQDGVEKHINNKCESYFYKISTKK